MIYANAEITDNIIVTAETTDVVDATAEIADVITADASITENVAANAEITEGITADAELTTKLEHGDLDQYDGPYEVNPTTEIQTLRTKGLLMKNDITINDIKPATQNTLGAIIVGDDLIVTEEGMLSIDKATAVEDNTKPITAAAVYAEVGNINALLQTI